MEIFEFRNYNILSDGTVIGARGKPLKVDLNSCGYERVSLCKEGRVTRCFVHQLVASHYVPRTSVEQVYVNHIDGDKRNNCSSNLEWVTPSENVKDGYRRGRINPHKYTPEFIRLIRIMYKHGGWSVSKIAKVYRKDRGTILKYIKQ